MRRWWARAMCARSSSRCVSDVHRRFFVRSAAAEAYTVARSVWWRIRRTASHDPRAQTTKAAPVEYIVLPRPTSGETMPPKANPAAPSRADAVPDSERVHSMASVVEVVKVRPIEKSSPMSSPNQNSRRSPPIKKTFFQNISRKKVLLYSREWTISLSLTKTNGCAIIYLNKC